MTWDDRAHDTNHAEYFDVLNVVQCTMYKYEAYYVIFGGDLNADNSRSTLHTANHLEIISEYDIGLCIDMEHIDAR